MSGRVLYYSSIQRSFDSYCVTLSVLLHCIAISHQQTHPHPDLPCISNIRVPACSLFGCACLLLVRQGHIKVRFALSISWARWRLRTAHQVTKLSVTAHLWQLRVTQTAVSFNRWHQYSLHRCRERHSALMWNRQALSVLFELWQRSPLVAGCAHHMLTASFAHYRHGHLKRALDSWNESAKVSAGVEMASAVWERGWYYAAFTLWSRELGRAVEQDDQLLTALNTWEIKHTAVAFTSWNQLWLVRRLQTAAHIRGSAHDEQRRAAERLHSLSSHMIRWRQSVFVSKTMNGKVMNVIVQYVCRHLSRGFYTWRKQHAHVKAAHRAAMQKALQVWVDHTEVKLAHIWPHHSATRHEKLPTVVGVPAVEDEDPQETVRRLAAIAEGQRIRKLLSPAPTATTLQHRSAQGSQFGVRGGPSPGKLVVISENRSCPLSPSVA